MRCPCELKEKGWEDLRWEAEEHLRWVMHIACLMAQKATTPSEDSTAHLLYCAAQEMIAQMGEEVKKR